MRCHTMMIVCCVIMAAPYIRAGEEKQEHHRLSLINLGLQQKCEFQVQSKYQKSTLDFHKTHPNFEDIKKITRFSDTIVQLIAEYCEPESWDYVHARLGKKEDMHRLVRHIKLFRDPDGRDCILSLVQSYYWQDAPLNLSVWDIDREAQEFPLGKNTNVLLADVSPTGDVLAYIPCSKKRQIHFWHLQQNKSIDLLDAQGSPSTPLNRYQHPQPITSCTFSPRGTYIMSTCKERYIRIWTSPEERDPKFVSKGARYAEISPDETLMLTSNDQGFKVMNFNALVSQKIPNPLWEQPYSCFCRPTFSPKGTFVISILADDGRTLVSHARSGEKRCVINEFNQSVCRRMTDDERQIVFAQVEHLSGAFEDVFDSEFVSDASSVAIVQLHDQGDTPPECELVGRYHATTALQLGVVPNGSAKFLHMLAINDRYMAHVDSDGSTIVVRAKYGKSENRKKWLEFIGGLVLIGVSHISPFVVAESLGKVWRDGPRSLLAQRKIFLDRLSDPDRNLVS